MCISRNLLHLDNKKSLILCVHCILIYVLHTHFVRGAKVQLFCSPQCQWHIKKSQCDSSCYHRLVVVTQRFLDIARPDWVGTVRRCNHTPQYVGFVKWRTQSGLAISRKRCFPPGGQHLVQFMAPKEDFWRLNKALRIRFEVLFKGVGNGFWATTDGKLAQNAYATLCSAVENLRLVSIKLMLSKQRARTWQTVGSFEELKFTLKRRFWKDEQKMKAEFYAPQTSRRQLIPLFDKPAFSRFSPKGEPRFVVEIIGKIVKRQVCQKWGWVADGCYGSVNHSPSNLCHVIECLPIFIWKYLLDVLSVLDAWWLKSSTVCVFVPKTLFLLSSIVLI